MASRKTCDKCANYISSNLDSVEGECNLMGDSNEGINDIYHCSGWDYEGYRAGVYVGPKFGCIHWIKKEKA